MNQIRKGIVFTLLLVAVALSTCIPIWAAEDSPKQVVIELEAVSEEREHYLPNEQVDYTLILKNKLGPSWLRIKFTFIGKNVDKTFVDDDLNIQNNWVKQGDYFYYTKKAEAYTDYTVIKGITIPDAIPVGKDANVSISVYGEAIQYDGFNPDFNSKEPWKGAESGHTANISGFSSHHSSRKSSLQENSIYSSPQENGNVMEGQWELVNIENHSWKYKNGNGSYIKNGWIYVKNPYSAGKEKYDWFHFDKDGIMTFGWYRTDNDVWYYCHEISDGNLGMMIKGWHEDRQSGKKYFLDKKTGIMVSGWQEIDGHSYYFATAADIPKQTWFWRTFWDTRPGKWIYEYLGYRSFGSMYINEETPDGQKVNEAGMKE